MEGGSLCGGYKHLGLALLLVLSLGCGDEVIRVEPGLTCNEGRACGGELTGVWSIEQPCQEFIPRQVCGPDSTWAEITYTGTYVMNGDGSMDVDLIASGPIHYAFTEECLQGNTCQDIEDDAHIDGLLAFSCFQEGDVCLCTDNYNQEYHQAGSWNADGSSVILQAGGAMEIAEYCVQGNALRLVTGAGVQLMTR